MLIGQALLITCAAMAGRLWLGQRWEQVILMCCTWVLSVGLILFMYRPWRGEAVGLTTSS
jgi:hypothetical protein